MEDSVRPIRLNPEDWPGYTPEQLEHLQQMAEDAGRELREYNARTPYGEPQPALRGQIRVNDDGRVEVAGRPAAPREDVDD